MSLNQNPRTVLMFTAMLCTALFGIFTVIPALAANERLFGAEVVVDPDSDQAGQIRAALDAVLIKLTGQTSSVTDPRLSKLRDEAQTHLMSFSYQERLVPDGAYGKRQRVLRAQFNQRQVIEELQRQSIELWSLERPEVLLWLAIEDQQGQRDMLAGDDRQHRFALEQAARERGLPLVLPVQDQTDYSLLDADSIWGGFYENAELASQRYAADRYAIAAASRRGDNWQVRWRLPDDATGLETFQSIGPELSAALVAGINSLADRIAALNRVSSSTEISRTVRVMLRNIQSPAQYAVAARAFDAMSQVKQVTVVQAEADAIEIRLALSASRDWLLQAIRLADELSMASVQPNGSELIYVDVLP